MSRLGVKVGPNTHTRQIVNSQSNLRPADLQVEKSKSSAKEMHGKTAFELQKPHDPVVHALREHLCAHKAVPYLSHAFL